MKADADMLYGIKNVCIVPSHKFFAPRDYILHSFLGIFAQRNVMSSEMVLVDAPPVNELYTFTRNAQGEDVNKDGKDKREQIFWDKKVAEAAKKLAVAQAVENYKVPSYDDGDERGW
jgi:hypothetical protein